MKPLSSRTWWLLPLGIICGISVTFLIRSMIQQGATSTASPVHDNPVSSHHQSIDYWRGNQSHTSSGSDHSTGSQLEKLQEEKTILLKRLRQVEDELNRVRPTNPVTTTSPTLPPATTKTAPFIENKLKTGNTANSLSKGCPYDFKVYVYPIPSSVLALKISEEARHNGTLHVCQKCILEQFALEYIMYDFFTQFCGRTYKAEEADFFYLPLVRDAEFRVTLQEKGIRQRAPSAAEVALLNILEKNDGSTWKQIFNTTDYYWHRHNGADHIIVMPAPVTNLRHETSQRGFFHYMMHLHRPIFLGLEFSKQFVAEYPICAKEKNIVVPYPTTDPDLFNGKLLNYKIERNALLYYAGGLHGDCVEVRKAMKTLMVNSSSLDHVIPKIRSVQEEREHGFLAATFCPIPVGDSPSSKRMYDVLNFGCIPVVVSDDLVWAYSDQTGGVLDHNMFSIQMPQSVVQFTIERTLQHYAKDKAAFGKLPSGILLYDLLEESYRKDATFENGVYVNPLVRVLRRVPAQDIETLKKHGKEAGEKYRYYQYNPSMVRIPTQDHVFPTGGAMDMICLELSERKAKQASKISDECQVERKRPGVKYISRFSCDIEKTDSLIRRRRLSLL